MIQWLIRARRRVAVDDDRIARMDLVAWLDVIGGHGDGLQPGAWRFPRPSVATAVGARHDVMDEADRGEGADRRQARIFRQRPSTARPSG